MPPVNNRNRGAKVSSEWPVIQQFLRLIRTSRLVEAYRRKAPDSSKGSAPATFSLCSCLSSASCC
jgi:hypothetical protein